MEPPVQPTAAVNPLVRRVLVVLGTGAVFLLLVALGLGLAALLSPGDTARPEPVVVRPPPPAPRPEPAPPPPASPPAIVREVARPPPPQPAPLPEASRAALSPGALTLPARLRVRREVIRAIGALKEDLGQCPADPVQRSGPQGRAALVLETESLNNAVRVVRTTLEADVPVNDRFVACARQVLAGKQLAATGIKPGVKLRVFLPLGPTGNSISLGSASLAEAGGP